MHSILIVEDETPIAENLIYALETEHFQTVHTTKGMEVQELVKSHDFDLIVLDVGLPDISGFDVCKELRSHSEIPVLFLTARNSEIDHVLGLELGADDYVTKPFSPRALVARIRAILRRTTNHISSEEVLPPCGIHHDASAMTISCEGTVLDLTAHEYKLLATFLSSPGRTFTREQLLERAWDDPYAAMDRTVDAHIKSIRAKLKKISEKHSNAIQTRRGLGYLYSPSQP
ncbi:transcriptional regulatory protein CreB [Rubritalea halochordaticola]|uniref:Transcriptional regulatory protein CreB n=1 Tax=Rubritalea halochordaticola TaxID=714537 RepID=A0ABP9UZS6_9BACT